MHGYFENGREMIDGEWCEVRTQMLYDVNEFDEHQFKCELLKHIKDRQIRTIYLWRIYKWDMTEEAIKVGRNKHIIAVSYYATHYMVKCKEYFEGR